MVRYTQRALIGIGLLLAIALNVSSVRVARTLWLDRDARQAMVDAAGNYTKNNPAATTDPVKMKEQLQSDVNVFSDVTTSACRWDGKSPGIRMRVILRGPRRMRPSLL